MNGDENFQAGEKQGAIHADVQYIKKTLDEMKAYMIPKVAEHSTAIAEFRGALAGFKIIGGIVGFVLSLLSIASIVMAMRHG